MNFQITFYWLHRPLG